MSYDTASIAAERDCYREEVRLGREVRDADARAEAIYARQCELADDRQALAENVFCNIDYRDDYSTGYLMADAYLATRAAGLVPVELHKRIVDRFDSMATAEIDGKPSGLLAMFGELCRPASMEGRA